MSPHDPQLTELGEAAREAAAQFNHHVSEITMEAERRAEEMVACAEADADAVRRDAVESGRRVYDRISALERPLADLVRTLRQEVTE